MVTDIKELVWYPVQQLNADQQSANLQDSASWQLHKLSFHTHSFY